MMRAAITPLTLAGLLLIGVINPSIAQPAQPTPGQGAPAQPAPGQPAPRRSGACAQITAACKQAGFVPKGAKTGVGIFVDCIRPIMAGAPQGVKGTKPLP